MYYQWTLRIFSCFGRYLFGFQNYFYVFFSSCAVLPVVNRQFSIQWLPTKFEKEEWQMYSYVMEKDVHLGEQPWYVFKVSNVMSMHISASFDTLISFVCINKEVMKKNIHSKCIIRCITTDVNGLTYIPAYLRLCNLPNILSFPAARN